MSESPSEYASDVYDLHLDTGLTASVAVLAIYEYLITFDGEVSHIWRHKKTLPTVLLLVMRWAMVLQVVTSLLQPTTPGGCAGVIITNNIFVALTSALTAGFSGLRAYALWGRSQVLFLITSLLGLSATVVNLYNLNGVFEINAVYGCAERTRYGPKMGIELNFIARIPAILSDALVVGITWAKTYRQLCEGRRLGIPMSLSALVLRDGTVYFLILFVVNVLELCPNLPDRGQAIAELNTSLAPILLNRFMLNLRQLDETGATSGGHLYTISTPMFRVNVDVTGNMGESLEFGRNREDDLDADNGSSGHAECVVDIEDTPALELYGGKGPNAA